MTMQRVQRLVLARMAAFWLGGMCLVALMCGAAEQALTDELEGQRLAARLRESPPQEEMTLRGRLSIRDADGNLQDLPFQFKTSITASNWLTLYRCSPLGPRTYYPLAVIHAPDRANTYWEAKSDSPDSWVSLGDKGPQTLFAGSDFSMADLGLEFLHWPRQKLIKTEMRKNRSCHVLESSKPTPAPGEYRRVVSWLDVESGGLILAEAYDSQNKLLKEFSVNSMKKVEERWQVQQMEIRNVQTRSRTRLSFEVK